MAGKVCATEGFCFLSWRDIAISPSSELSESYHISIKLPCLVEPLFPFPAGPFLSIWEGGGSHNDSKLLGYPSLEGIYEDAVIVNSTAHLGKFESSGVLLRDPRNLISSSAHSSVVRGHVEFQGLSSSFSGTRSWLDLSHTRSSKRETRLLAG